MSVVAGALKAAAGAKTLSGGRPAKKALPKIERALVGGAVEGHCRATGVNLDSMVMPRIYERYQAAARTELGEATWQEALTEGRAMPLEGAISYALEDAEGHA